MKKQVVIIKLGGSIITDKTKPYTPNLPAIKKLAREIKKADVPVIIIHGQGSFAHTSAKKYGGMKGYKSRWGIAKVARDAMEMNRIVMDELLNAKLPAISFRPNSLFLASEGNLLNQNLETVFQALKQGLTPVLYGDVIMDKSFKTTIFSGEKTTSLLVDFLMRKKVKISRIIQVGITDGVYNENKKTVPNVTINNYKEIKENIFNTSVTDVTGGMQHKIESSLKLAQKGMQTHIINGNRVNELYKTLTGNISKGTIISK